MLKYNIEEGQNGRVILVSTDDLQRWALHDSNDIPLHFEISGKQAIAVTHGPIKLYRKPTGLHFHKEYMIHNGRSLWLGFYPDFSRLARNMYDFRQYI
jgi:hypothetical protein